jgi:uncharacterized alpha-E superfamily protein
MSMLSRVADSLYWMGRYLERAENMARLLEVTRDLLVDLGEVDPEGARAQWRATVEALAVADTNVDDVVFDSNEPSSLVSCIGMARENARQVREVIAAEMWQHLNQAYWAVEEAKSQPKSEARLVGALTQVQAASFLWDGVTDATMRRGEGWLFLKLGKFVERTDRLGRTIGVRVASRKKEAGEATTSQENFMWITLLKSMGGLEAYRKEHPTKVDSRSVLGFLVFDREFPRAVRYAARTAADFAQRLSVLHASPDDDVSRAFGKMAARLDYGDVREVLDQGPTKFLNNVSTEINAASLVLSRKYFLL